MKSGLRAYIYFSKEIIFVLNYFVIYYSKINYLMISLFIAFNKPTDKHLLKHLNFVCFSFPSISYKHYVVLYNFCYVSFSSLTNEEEN